MKIHVVRQYVKLCELEDFEQPDVLRAIRSLVPERDPLAHVERKVWEMAMTMLFLEEAGHLHERSAVLSVGAGIERLLFWLTNHVGKVVATDIYGESSFAGQEAPAEMLTDPGRFAPAYPTRLERLEARRMDARALDFPEESFDAVYSLSSIEHFGGPSDVAQAAAEIGRVLRPGGHAVIVTDCFVRRHPLDAAPVDLGVRVATLGRRYRGASLRRRARLGDVFTPGEIERLIVRPSALRLVQQLDRSVSERTWGTLATPPDQYPRVLVRGARSVFTSVFIALEKPRGQE